MQLKAFDVFRGKNDSLHLETIEGFPKKIRLKVAYSKVNYWYWNMQDCSIRKVVILEWYQKIQTHFYISNIQIFNVDQDT